MPTFVIEATRWPGMQYAEREQEAPDVHTAIRQFLTAQGVQEWLDGYRIVPHTPEGVVPAHCNVVYQVEGDEEHLVAAFTVPIGRP